MKNIRDLFRRRVGATNHNNEPAAPDLEDEDEDDGDNYPAGYNAQASMQIACLSELINDINQPFTDWSFHTDHINKELPAHLKELARDQPETVAAAYAELLIKLAYDDDRQHKRLALLNLARLAETYDPHGHANWVNHIAERVSYMNWYKQGEEVNE